MLLAALGVPIPSSPSPSPAEDVPLHSNVAPMRFVGAVVVMSLVVAAVAAVGFAAAAFVVAPPRPKGDEAEDMVEASGLYRTTSSLHGALAVVV